MSKKQEVAPRILLGALDQGTTSTRFIIFDSLGNMVSRAQKEHTQIMPHPGWVEHDPLEIWDRVQEVITEAMTGFQASDLSCIGITNQRETTIVWNKQTGKPYGNAIVWMDTRTQPLCDSLLRDREGEIRETTGLPVSPYFSATKIRWILDHNAEAKRDAELGLAVAGTIDSWLLFNLSGGQCHCTDVSNASRYMLMDLHTLQWDTSLCSLLQIPHKMLPTICSSSQVFFSAELPQCVKGVKVSGVLGDQQSALVGQLGFHPGMAKNTYGTGLFMLLNTGNTIVRNPKLITTVAFKMGQNAPVYALEGSVAIGGALIQWLRDNLGIIESASQVETLAKEVSDNGGVVVVPAFSGLFAPYWQPTARGVVCGLTRYANKRHICRAAIEATAFQTHDVFAAMQEEEGVELKELRVDGGMVVNDTLLQFQADILNVPVTRPRITETTAFGAVCAAGLAVGVWNSLQDIERDWPGVECSFTPSMEASKRKELLATWKKAVQRSMHWED